MTVMETETQPIAEIQEEIVEEFELFDDWTERYRYIIEIGRKLPDLPEDLKTEENIVRGCQSQVWLHGALVDGRIIFQADSDAMIVRGLVALILRVYSNHTPGEILGTAPTFIERIGMSEHLSMSRANGLRAMVKQIKAYALAYQSLLEKGQSNHDTRTS